MNTCWTPLKTALAIALCGAALTLAPARAGGQAAAPVVQPAAAILPGDDFFTYANSDWLSKTQIPADRGSWGAMGALAEDTNVRIAQAVRIQHHGHRVALEGHRAKYINLLEIEEAHGGFPV